jgi:type IV pilus assembly protein PilA
MKNKGFTLIELLAVVTIMAILISLAIPAITAQIVKSRTNTYVENANRMVTACKDAVLSSEYEELLEKGNSYVTESDGVITFHDKAIDALLEKGNDSSPFGGDYIAKKIQFVMSDTKIQGVYICLVDSSHNGFEFADGFKIKNKDVKLGTAGACGDYDK